MPYYRTSLSLDGSTGARDSNLGIEENSNTQATPKEPNGTRPRRLGSKRWDILWYSIRTVRSP